MWAQVPNWKSGDPMWIRQPEPPWVPPPRVKGQPRPKRPPPHDPETLDWLAALKTVDLDAAAHARLRSAACPLGNQGQEARRRRPSPAPLRRRRTPRWRRARAEAMRDGGAHARHRRTRDALDAVDPIFKLAFEYDGVFRDECGRAIRSMDSYAVPRLVRLDAPAERRQDVDGQAAALRRLSARPHGSAAAAKGDRDGARRPRARRDHPRLRRHARARRRRGDPRAGRLAVASRAARGALGVAAVRHRQGAAAGAQAQAQARRAAREEAEEKPDYLTYREIATLALQKELAAIHNAPVGSEEIGQAAHRRAVRLLRQAARRRVGRAVSVGEGQRIEPAILQAATDEYGWILAHDPNYGQRAEMAHAFLQMGEALRGKNELPRAVGYYRQAVDLDPNGPDAKAAKRGSRSATG